MLTFPLGPGIDGSEFPLKKGLIFHVNSLFQGYVHKVSFFLGKEEKISPISVEFEFTKRVLMIKIFVALT